MKIYIYLLTFLLTSTLASQDDFSFSSSSIGGYGELHYNRTIADSKTNTLLDFHRFVLFYGHQWNDSWSFKAEVELEHNFVKEGQGELELEQAYIDYNYDRWFGFQAGVVLPSVGLINEYHEPPLFFGVERPDYHKYIIPTTWFGNGISFYGNYADLDYKFTIMEGLDADKISNKNGIRSARQKGYKPNADYLLYNGRVDYTGIRGLRFGFSYSYNNASGDSLDIPLSILEGHIKYSSNNIFFVGEFATINYQEGKLEQSLGYYFDLGYDLSNLIGIKTQIIPFARFTNYNTAASTIQGGNSEKEFNITKWMIGLNVLPISEVVFKIDYGVAESELTKRETQYFNLGVGYMF